MSFNPISIIRFFIEGRKIKHFIKESENIATCLKILIENHKKNINNQNYDNQIYKYLFDFLLKLKQIKSEFLYKQFCLSVSKNLYDYVSDEKFYLSYFAQFANQDAMIVLCDIMKERLKNQMRLYCGSKYIGEVIEKYFDFSYGLNTDTLVKEGVEIISSFIQEKRLNFYEAMDKYKDSNTPYNQSDYVEIKDIILTINTIITEKYCNLYVDALLKSIFIYVTNDNFSLSNFQNSIANSEATHLICVTMEIIMNVFEKEYKANKNLKKDIIVERYIKFAQQITENDYKQSAVNIIERFNNI